MVIASAKMQLADSFETSACTVILRSAIRARLGVHSCTPTVTRNKQTRGPARPSLDRPLLCRHKVDAQRIENEFDVRERKAKRPSWTIVFAGAVQDALRSVLLKDTGSAVAIRRVKSPANKIE